MVLLDTRVHLILAQLLNDCCQDMYFEHTRTMSAHLQQTVLSSHRSTTALMSIRPILLDTISRIISTLKVLVIWTSIMVDFLKLQNIQTEFMLILQPLIQGRFSFRVFSNKLIDTNKLFLYLYSGLPAYPYTIGPSYYGVVGNANKVSQIPSSAVKFFSV